MLRTERENTPSGSRTCESVTYGTNEIPTYLLFVPIAFIVTHPQVACKSAHPRGIPTCILILKLSCTVPRRVAVHPRGGCGLSSRSAQASPSRRDGVLDPRVTSPRLTRLSIFHASRYYAIATVPLLDFILTAEDGKMDNVQACRQPPCCFAGRTLRIHRIPGETLRESSRGRHVSLGRSLSPILIFDAR